VTLTLVRRHHERVRVLVPATPERAGQWAVVK
jgi:hypothetical protein